MMPFIPWMGLGDAQTAQGVPAAPRRLPFPGRTLQAMPAEQAAPPQVIDQDPATWTPHVAGPANFVGPLEGPATLPGAQDSIEAQAEQAAAEDAAAQAAAAAGAAGGQTVPRETAATQVTETRTKTAGTPTLAELIGNLNKRELDSLKQQGLSVEKLKKRLVDLEATDLPADLTGLAALTDAWTGSNFAGVYKPTETGRERKSAVERLQNQILQAEQGMTENEIALLRSQLNNAFQMENLDYRKTQDAQQNEFERQRLQLEKAKLAKSANPLDPMAAWKMRTDIEKLDTTKATRGNIELINALNNYEAMVDKYGTNPTGEGAAALDNAYSAITLAYKNAGELGALSGPDMGIVEQGVRNTGDLTSWFKSGLKGGTAGVKTQIKQMRGATKAGFDRRMGSMRELTKGYEPLVGDYVGEFQGQMDKAMGTSDLKTKSRSEKEAELQRLRAAKAARAGKGQ